MTRIASGETDHYPVLEAALTERKMPFWHHRDSRGTVRGIPDYCIVAGDWLMFAELKAIGGAPTTDQWFWLHRLRGPWRGTAVVAVDALDELLRLVDAMKAGSLEGLPGLRAVLVLGSVRVPRGFDGGRVVGRAAAEGPTPIPSSRRRPCTPRRPRGS